MKALYIYFIYSSSIDSLLGSFHILAVMNNAMINIEVQISL